jgi:hypothetical protein
MGGERHWFGWVPSGNYRMKRYPIRDGKIRRYMQAVQPLSIKGIAPGGLWVIAQKLLIKRFAYVTAPAPRQDRIVPGGLTP